MTSLLEELKREKGGPECPIAKLLESLDGDDKALADELRTAIGDLKWSGGELTRVLQRRGFKLGNNAVNNHRKGTCSCGR